ncbi:hypothetical protein [Bacteroides ihuae]|uniref:hypothetical protein n=1 Tax=Bacteroides ihuae TaxID=1852362 RepID=UPI0008DAAB4E|nr:hypothetical protein [Bacteroides ihuae]
MKLIVNIVIILITILALIIIVVIGLDVQNLKWGSSANAQDINSILINLSYSYIAGAIFYFLVTTIPFYLRRKKINIVIKDRLNIISASTQTIIFAYDPSSINFTLEQIEKIDLDRVNEEELLNLFKRSTVFNISNVARQVLPQANSTIFFTVKQLLQKIDKTIEETLSYYFNYLSEEQIILLNKVKNSEFKNMISSSTDDILNRSIFSQPQVINSLAEYFIVFWKDVKKLNSISK